MLKFLETMATRVGLSATARGWAELFPRREMLRLTEQEESPSEIRQNRSIVAATRLKGIAPL
jgi:hypothetical protein